MPKPEAAAQQPTDGDSFNMLMTAAVSPTGLAPSIGDRFRLLAIQAQSPSIQAVGLAAISRGMRCTRILPARVRQRRSQNNRNRIEIIPNAIAAGGNWEQLWLGADERPSTLWLIVAVAG